MAWDMSQRNMLMNAIAEKSVKETRKIDVGGRVTSPCTTPVSLNQGSYLTELAQFLNKSKVNVLVRMLEVVAKSSQLSSFANNFKALQPF